MNFVNLFITNNIELALLTIVEKKMATFGTLNEFSGIEKDWSSYYEPCEFYFVANTIEDNSVKRAVFLSVVGDSTYKLIRDVS